MQLIVYPNPNSGKFYVELKDSKSKRMAIELINSSGELVYNSDFAWDKTKLIDLTGIETGNYSLHVKGDRFEIQKEIVIQSNTKSPHKIVDSSIEVGMIAAE